MPTDGRHDETHPDHALMGDGTEWQRRLPPDRPATPLSSRIGPSVERQQWVQDTIHRRAARIRAHVSGSDTTAWLRQRAADLPGLAALRERLAALGTRGRLGVTGACIALTLTGLVAVIASGPEHAARSESAAVQPADGEAAETPTPVLGAPVATYVMIITGTPPTPLPIATPLPPPQLEPALRPTATSAIPRAAAIAATIATRGPALLVVVNSDPEGVSIRKEPSDGERIRVWQDGTPMVPLAEERQIGGRTWKKVRDPEGNEGWIAAEFLAESGAGPVTPPTTASPSATPAPSPTETRAPSPTRTPRPSTPPTPTPGLVRPGSPLFGPGSSATSSPAGTPSRSATQPPTTPTRR